MQHREWLQMALDAAQVGTWSWHPTTNEMVWSDQTESIFGVPQDAFEGTYEAFLDLVHAEDRNAVTQRIETALHGSPDRYEVEHRIVRPDGAIRWVDNRGQMVQPTDDQPPYMAGAVVDVTDRKERERTSRESEAYRQQLYQITSDPDLTGEEKVQRLLALGCERLGVENGFVSHIDEATGRYEVQMAYGSDYVQAGAVTDLSTMYCERTIESDDILGIYNAAEEGWDDHPSYKLLHVGCYMGGKILVDNDLYGTLCFVNRAPRAQPFTHDEKAFVDLMTRWVSHVLERREWERELQKSEHYRQQLYQITSATGLSGEEKIQQLLEIGCKHLGVENGIVTRIDEAAGRYEIQMAYGSDFVQAGVVTDLLQTFCRKTITSDDILGIYNALEEGFGEDPGYKRWGIGCYMGGKILVDNDLYGTLCFVNQKPREQPFTHTEKAFVDLMTRWVSHVFERRKHTQDLRLKDRAMEAAPIGITITDPQREDNPLVYVNEKFQRLTGYSSKESLGRNCRFLQGEATDPEPVAELRAAIDANEPATVELRNYRKDGTAFWNRASIAPVVNNAGEVTHFVGFQEDVTERKEADRKLREREQRLQRYKQYTDDLLNAIDDLLYVTDETGALLRWNETLPAVTGYSHEEIASMPALEIFAEDDRDAVRAAIEEVIRTGSGRVEAHLITEEGASLPYEFAAGALEDPDGNQVLAGIGRDISERQEREQRLQQLTKEYEAVFNNTQDAIFLFDVEDEDTFRVSRINPAEEELVGLATAEVKEKTLYDLIERGLFDKETVDKLVAGYRRCLEMRRPITIEDEYQMPSGTRTFQTNLAPVISDGEVTQIVGVTRDITERKERERELRQSKRQFEAVFNDPKMLVALLDPDGTLCQINPTSFEYTNVGRDAVIGEPFPATPWWKDTPAEDVQEWIDRAATGAYVEYEAYLDGPDGIRRWVNGTFRPVTNEAGDVVSIVVSAHDVTERKEREQQLERYKQYTDDILDAIDDVFYVLDVEGDVQRWNESLSDATGYPDEEIMSMHALDFFDEADQKPIADAIEVVFKTGETRVEAPFLTKDGAFVPYEFVAARLEDPDGNPVLAGIGRDVSERRARERRLHERERQLSTLMSNIPGMVYRCQNEPNWPMEFVSEGCRELTGYEPEALMRDDVNWAEDIILKGNDDLWEQVQRSLEEKRPFRVTFPIKTADGERRWVKEQGRGVYAADGTLEALEGVIIDITERVAYEQELKRTTALLQRIQRMAQIGGWELDMRTDPPVSTWTDELYRLHNLPRDVDIDLESIVNCYHPDDRERVREVIESSLASGTGYDIEARMVTGPDGLRWVRAIGDAIYEDDELIAYRGAIQDITDRKRYEERLRASKEYAESLIASMQDGFAVFDTDLRQVQVNEALCRMTGLAPDELIGAEPPYPYWPPEELDAIQAEFEKMTEGHQLKNLELVFKRKNGERFPVIVAPSTLTDEAGEVVHYFATMKDITERKRAEEALKESEARFRTLVENTPVIFFATDRDGVFTVSEGQQLERLGLEPGELVGQSISDAYADYPVLIENIRRILAGEERTWRVELEGRILDAYGAPLRDENGAVTGVIGVATDVTERTRVARENARLVEDLRTMSVRLLETQEQERRRVARELHDEAGALLTSLQMCLDTAHQHVPAETNDDASIAREELMEAQELTSTLSTQIRQMALTLRPSVLDDLGLAAALQWLVDQHAKRTGLTIHLYHELGERQRFAEAIETAAYRIVQEALTNASRYAGVEEVQVMVNVLEDQLRIHVLDEGRGFDLERVQKESETVGLSSMRERAELLQGELEIATAPGEGTRISATLPTQPPG